MSPRTLKNAVAQNRLAHAYPLRRPARRRKDNRTAANFGEVAQLRERTPRSHRAANVITAARLPPVTVSDVIEIDGASNNSVEDVRQTP